MSLDPNLTQNRDESYFREKLDEAAFEVFFKQNFIPLTAFCQYKFGFDLDQAKEIVHTSFIKLWENRETISPNLSLRSYIYKIITNNSLDILKHEKVKQKHRQYIMQNVSEAAPGDPFNAPGFKQLNADVDKAIAELPEQMRHIFELSRYEGLKYAEIANQLNISVKTVETQMSRALNKLRQKLAGYLTITLLMWVISYFLKK